MNNNINESFGIKICLLGEYKVGKSLFRAHYTKKDDKDRKLERENSSSSLLSMTSAGWI